LCPCAEDWWALATSGNVRAGVGGNCRVEVGGNCRGIELVLVCEWEVLSSSGLHWLLFLLALLGSVWVEEGL